MTKADQLAAALDDFLSVSPEVEAAAVVSSDGLPMASALPPYVEEDRLAAMSAALLTLGDRAAEGLDKGRLAQVFVQGERGYVVLMSGGDDAVLVAITSNEAKAGLILFEMRRTAGAVEAIMSRAAAPAAPQTGQLAPETGQPVPETTAPEVGQPAPERAAPEHGEPAPEPAPVKDWGSEATSEADQGRPLTTWH